MIKDKSLLDGLIKIGWLVLIALSVLFTAILIAIFVNHIRSPEITRGALYESVNRLINGLTLYPKPSIDYVPLAYNPLFSVLGGLFYLITGPSPATLRLTAVVGSIGTGLLIYLAVRRETTSNKFAIIALGIYAGAYLTFDSYLDYANPDSWMLFTGLLGLYILQASRKQAWIIVAILILCTSFWFKQHGAFFVIAGVLYLTWIYGFRKSMVYSVLAFICGPLAFLTLGPVIFGEYMLYYTIKIPGTWTTINIGALDRYSVFLMAHWANLFIFSILALFAFLFSKSTKSIWIFSLPVILLMGFIGSFDAGGENNVYIAPAIWLIIVGTGALADLLQTNSWILKSIGLEINHAGLYTGFINLFAICMLLVSFHLNLYDPKRVFTPTGAWSAYNDLINFVKSLDGVVYLPDVGQFQSTYRLPIPVHQVAAEDLVRGTGRGDGNDPLILSIYQELIEPDGNAYIITFNKLENYPVLSALHGNYILVEDFGERFELLKPLPGRFSGSYWPRYLYAYQGLVTNFK
jgi:hypothetical protein